MTLLLLCSPALAGCVTAAPPAPLPTSLTAPLPTLAPDSAAASDCQLVDLRDARLAGDTDDPRLVWLELPIGRQDVAWPSGYGMRTYRFGVRSFDVVDPAGNVAYTEGDVIAQGCVAGPPGDPRSILLLPPPNRRG